MALRIIDADAHFLEGGDFILELAEAHPDKVKLPAAGEGLGALIEGKRYPTSSGPGCGVDTQTSITPKATNRPSKKIGPISDTSERCDPPPS